MEQHFQLKNGWFVVVESRLTRRIELLRLCARIGYSPH
jgi:hypothetical protein